MAPGIVSSYKGGRGPDPEARLTLQVLLCSIIAAFGGLMFGYDLGISGGVTSMDDFLIKFFPDVYVKKHRAEENNYCKYDNQSLQLFTSSLYLAAIVASFFASHLCRKFGRRTTMRAASIFFLIGAILNLTARNLVMLIFGRLFLGFGVGFGNQTVPLFISEIAPPKFRGGLNITFQLMITIGILIANLLNYKLANVHPKGWSYALGGAAVPALILCLGSLLIVETPTSLIERGKTEEGKRTLKKIRGTEHVDAEFEELVRATDYANQIKQPFKNLFKRSNRPPFICGTIIQVFQQFTGMNVIMFYAPVLFQTMGFKSDASLLSAVVTGVVNAFATLVATFTVDRIGRRALFIEGAIQLFLTQCIIGGILSVHLKATNVLDKNLAVAIVILVCLFVAGFAWSWGPLCWLVPSEIYPLEARTAGFFFAVGTNMFCTFIIAQAFLTMLCHMRAGAFFFFAVWVVIMLTFVIFLLPETMGTPIDEMVDKVWKKHWFWKRYFDDDDESGRPRKQQEMASI